MTAGTVELRLILTGGIAQKLREMAQTHGTTEEALIARALDALFALDEPSPRKDYWFSVAAMREDWETMPEDWIANEVDHAIPSR